MHSTNILEKDFYQFYFTKIEDTPLNHFAQRMSVASVALVSLLLGLLVHTKIFFMLKNRKKSNSSRAIDRLFFAHLLYSFVFHPPLFVYYISRNFFYPMSDYIGEIGCAIILLSLDIFIR